MLSILIALSGVLAVTFASFGSLYTFIFGIIQVSGYIYITYSQGLYGEMLLNLLVFLPAQLFAIYTWTRNSHNTQVQPKVLSTRGKVIFTVLIITVLFFYWQLIPFINVNGIRSIGNLTVVISLFAQLFMILRFKEQWLLWIISNILNIILWFEIVYNSANITNISMLIMWTMYLLINIFGLYYWNKLEKENK